MLKNQPKDQLATTIPVSGNFEKTDIELWATIGGILQNAFVRALVPKVDRNIDIKNLEPTSDRKDPPREGGARAVQLREPRLPAGAVQERQHRQHGEAGVMRDVKLLSRADAE